MGRPLPGRIGAAVAVEGRGPNMPRWRWLMAQLTRRLWVRATLIGLLGILAAILAAVVDTHLPWTIPGTISADALDSILTVIASSMLTVTTFSLNVMVSAYGSATSNVTPRATKLLIEDRLTQTVLSTFLGSFLFSIVGLVVSKTGAYGEQGRSILFVVTIAVIGLIVIALLRWIDHLTRLGRVGQTTDRVEAAAREAIRARLREPYLGGTALRDRQAIPPDALFVTTDRIGYVQHIDVPALSALCEKRDAEVFVTAVPGTFVYPHTPLARLRVRGGAADRERADALRGAVEAVFLIGEERSFDQDPRFGVAVMSEIGSRALSPATNDSGTAIDVIGRATRLLCLWARGGDAEGEGAESEGPKYPRVHVPPLDTADLIEDAFMLMARDGAGLIEVQLHIQKGLSALGRMGDEALASAARYQSRLALERAEAALPLDADRRRLHALVRALEAGDASPAPAG
ncbi:putative membrane protein [Methylobacterium sp. B4]|nr:putative membrane protein [Methylobacterium sp. B4]